MSSGTASNSSGVTRPAVILAAFLVANVAIQTLRLTWSLKPSAADHHHHLKGLLPSQSHRFPFATNSTLASNAVLFTPENASQGFSIPQLLALCHAGRSLTLTREWAIEAPENDNAARESLIRNFIHVCYPFEMMTSQGARSMGFCSDYIQYIYHANGRLVDEFGATEFHAKRVSCPNSTFIHGEYLTPALYDDVSLSQIDQARLSELTKLPLANLPQTVPAVRNMWLPNLEQTNKAHLSILPLFHQILCKTRITCTAMQQYVQKNQVYPTPKFEYMSHSSPDVLLDARHLFGDPFFTTLTNSTRSYNKFLHTHGRTGTKRTDQVVECWLTHADFPQLTIVGELSQWRSDLQEKAARAANIHLADFVDVSTLRALQIEHGVAICSSTQEGYGHYINDARSMGSLLLVTDHPPMSEFVNGDGVDGILIQPSGKPFSSDYQALSNEFKSIADVQMTDICAAVKRVLKMNENERKRIAMEGRKSYERDTAFMVEKMNELVEEAWQHLGRNQESLNQAQYVL
ncbi:hypothetical protein BC830DRAFT_1215609 [Chytriomyces sp. MP71]|nr:hypothetical protein BC830DRAFT_1215609 [Chytriomyces sp. MP71]